MICARKCPVHGIEGVKGLVHVIDQQMCIKCGSCFDACPEKFDAVKIITGAPVPTPLPEDQRAVVRKGKDAG